MNQAHEPIIDQPARTPVIGLATWNGLGFLLGE